MNTQHFIKRYGSILLSCVGAIGVVATAVMSAKGAPKALVLLKEAETEKENELTIWEKIKTAGPAYIPSAIVGGITLTCIIGSSIINERNQIALIGAYTLLNQSYEEYKRKTAELYGSDSVKNTYSQIAKDSTTCLPPKTEDKELFYDLHSGQYFESSSENVISAQYEANRAMAFEGVFYLNDYYKLLGLKPQHEYSRLGWDKAYFRRQHIAPWIDFEWEQTIIEEESEGSDGMNCTVIYFNINPTII